MYLHKVDILDDLVKEVHLIQLKLMSCEYQQRHWHILRLCFWVIRCQFEQSWPEETPAGFSLVAPVELLVAS